MFHFCSLIFCSELEAASDTSDHSNRRRRQHQVPTHRYVYIYISFVPFLVICCGRAFRPRHTRFDPFVAIQTSGSGVSSVQSHKTLAMDRWLCVCVFLRMPSIPFSCFIFPMQHTLRGYQYSRERAQSLTFHSVIWIPLRQSNETIASELFSYRIWFDRLRSCARVCTKSVGKIQFESMRWFVLWNGKLMYVSAKIQSSMDRMTDNGERRKYL